MFKNRSYPDKLLCNFLRIVHMCLHVLCMIEQRWVSVNSPLDSKKLKPMKKGVQGVTKIAFLQCNNFVVNSSILFEWMVKSFCSLDTSTEQYFLLDTCGIHFLYWRVKVGPFLLVDAKLAKRGYVRDTKIAIVKKMKESRSFFLGRTP